MNDERTLITGSSSGIGLALAHEFARHGHPLILTAPVQAELDELAQRLSSEHNVPVEVIAADLEQPAEIDRIIQFANSIGPVDILVNNAGLGQYGPFTDTSLDRDISIVRVNIEAILRLTKAFLPPMLQRGRGRLLNTASIAGFEPGPSMAVYHASKAFVLSFTEALATELEDTAISVTALCPGATDTDFFTKTNMEQTRMFQKGNVMAPQEVAEKGYKAMVRGERVYVPGGINKALAFSRRILTEKRQAKTNKKFYEEVDEHRRDRGDIEKTDTRHN